MSLAAGQRTHIALQGGGTRERLPPESKKDGYIKTFGSEICVRLSGTIAVGGVEVNSRALMILNAYRSTAIATGLSSHHDLTSTE